MSDQLVLMLIPARGNSKSIPRKNLVPLCGKSLLTWTVEQAVQAAASLRNAKVCLSTEDQEIRWAGVDAGAIWIPEPADLTGDDVPMEAVIAHALTQHPADWVVLLQPTSPLRLARHIEAAVYECIASADSVVSVTRTHKFIWGGNPGAVEPEGHPKDHRPLRQTLHPRYAENGAIYIARVEKFLQEGTRFCGRTVAYVMPEWTDREIDSMDDLDFVRMVLADRLRRGCDGIKT